MVTTYVTAGGRYDLRAEDEAAREQEQAQRSKRAGMADYRVEMGPDGEALSACIIDTTTAPQETHSRNRGGQHERVRVGMSDSDHSAGQSHRTASSTV